MTEAAVERKALALGEHVDSLVQLLVFREAALVRLQLRYRELHRIAAKNSFSVAASRIS